MKKIILLLFIFSLFACKTSTTLEGSLAPNFSISTFNGQTLELSGLKGRPVILYFFASW